MFFGENMNYVEYIIIAAVMIVILFAVIKANKEGIQKLGAKGIVEIDNQLKIILGSESKQLKKYIDEIK